MLRNLLGFELRLHTRQIGFWIALIVMVLVGVLFSSSEDFSIGMGGGERVKVNGAIPLALTISVFSLLSIFFAAVFVVTGVMRDDTHKAVEVVHATPVPTRDMLLSRMLGVWFATILTLSGLVFGTMIGQFMPWADPETFQAFNLWHYIQPFGLFIVVNALIISAIYTLIAVTTRNRALVYVSAVGLLVFYLLGSVVAGETNSDALSALVDPFGANALAVETQYWAAAEQNSRTAPIGGWIGINRILYSLIALAAFGLAFMLSTRGIVNRRTKTRRDDAPAVPAKRVVPVTPNLSGGFTLSAFWTRLRFEYLSTVRSTAFIILVGIAVTLFLISLLVGLYMGEASTLPTSRLMTDIALGSLVFPMLIIMVFFGSDIMWRDRTANMHGILDATPVRSVSLLFAKWGALAGVILTLIVGLLLAGMVSQALVSGGRTDVVPSTFFSVGIVSFFVGFAFQGMLVMFIQNFMPGRVVGMLVSAAVLIGFIFFIGQLPFFHPLMDFGSVGAGSYSEMAGFAAPKSFGWEFAYWSGLVLFLGALSIWVWRRGMQVGLGSRLRYIKKRISLPSLGTAVLGLALFGIFGAIGLNSYRADDYMNSDTREALQAELETLIGDSWKRVEPRIVDVTVKADFYPAEQTAVFDGRYIIDNPHDTAIERVSVRSGVGLDNIERLDIEGASPLSGDAVADRLRADFDVTDYVFTPPLQPGERRTVSFRTRFSAPTLTDAGDIERNGTFVNNSDALILFGGLESFFLSNPDTRRKYDLGEPLRSPERDDEEARRYHLLTGFSGYADYVDFEGEICTAESQIPVAPGKFQGETVADGRRCRSYKSINPILNFFAFLSAEYEVRTDTWTGNGQTVDLEIYFHPAHDYNIDLMFAAMKTAMDTFTETFTPYQYAQLRIMEFPRSAFAQAFAGTVPFSENIGFVQNPGDADDPKRVDLATYVTMHEIGHQWFAHQVVGANAKGSNLLSEGLTENATMLAYERHYDFAKARRMHEERTTEDYLLDRTLERDEEPVLAESDGQGYLDYNKTSWVMWGLRGYLGDDVVQPAVRRFLTQYAASNGAPYPTTLELIDIFEEDFPEDYHTLLDDYWNKITFWKLAVDGDVEVEPTGSTFQVSIPITLDKSYASEEDGKETSVSDIDGETLNEWVQVGFYTEDPKDDLGANPMQLETVRIDAAEKTLRFTVSERPTHVVLDPKRLLIEKNVKDNVKAVAKASDS